MNEFVFDVQPLVEAERVVAAFHGVEAIRRESRVKVFSPGLERRSSMFDAPRAWGVPRQRATRYVHQAMSASGRNGGCWCRDSQR